jgi:hypothetical protein
MILNKELLKEKISVLNTIIVWEWISKKPDGTEKDDYFSNINLQKVPPFLCYLCEYKINITKNTCPVFGICSLEHNCTVVPSVYKNWIINKTNKTANIVYIELKKFYEQKYNEHLPKNINWLVKKYHRMVR